MTPNPGHLPLEAIGKRVRVRLRHESSDPDPSTRPGWPADGPGGCRWSLTDDPFDIVAYEVL